MKVAITAEKATDLGIKIRKGDYDNKNNFIEGLKDIDVLLLVSGMDPPEKRILQHNNIIAAAKESGVRKIIYTSIIGAEQGNAFSPIVQSNRKTEENLINSGLKWVIGRNGLYIEPDIEYIENYKRAGEISNCASEGRRDYSEAINRYAQFMLQLKSLL